MVAIPVYFIASGDFSGNHIYVTHFTSPVFRMAGVGVLAGDLYLQPVAGGDDYRGGVISMTYSLISPGITGMETVLARTVRPILLLLSYQGSAAAHSMMS